jgi:AAA domain
MACITDREVELFSKRNELIDTLSEERESTPDEESLIARHERDSKTTKLFHGKAAIEDWRHQLGQERWDSITPEVAKEGPQLDLPIHPREIAVECYFAKHSATASSRGKSVALLAPTDASVKDLRKTGLQARTFQGFQRRPERAEVLVIDEASMLSVPQMLWLVKYACESHSRVLLVGGQRSAQVG